jgi:Tol biopolymer transport system component
MPPTFTRHEGEELSRRLSAIITTLGLTVLTVAVLAVGGVAAAAFPGPNGMIAFQDSNGHIKVMNPDGSGVRSISFAGGSDWDPAWSPDGNQIAFGRNEPLAGAGIWIMNEDGSHRVKVFASGASNSYPSWSPDGQHLVFQSNVDGGEAIYTINLDGSSLTKLVNGIQPAWSPNGDTIAFSSGSRIALIQPDGTGFAYLTSPPGNDFTPTWSPDATQVAFVRDGAVYKINVDGTGLTLVHQPSGAEDHDYRTFWSPAGDQIGFEAYVRPEPYLDPVPHIAVVATDGTGWTDLSASHSGYEYNGDWQPCGSGALCTSAALAKSALTGGVRKTKSSIRLSGTLFPPHAGTRLTATLSKKRGGSFHRLATARPKLGKAVDRGDGTFVSRYGTTFARPSAGTCRVKVRFAGDADHEPARWRRIFSC